MKNLIDKDFKAYYKAKYPAIGRSAALIKETKVSLSSSSFCIDDKGVASAPTAVLVINKSQEDTVHLFHYDEFQKQMPNSFQNGRLNCDYIILWKTDQFLFCELTTGSNEINLSKPIFNSTKNNVKFPGGKFEKVQYQLAQTVNTLMEVPSIKQAIDNLSVKLCILGYRVSEFASTKCTKGLWKRGCINCFSNKWNRRTIFSHHRINRIQIPQIPLP